MLFLYKPVPSLVRKHSDAFGSFFDDDYTCPSLVHVKRQSLQRRDRSERNHDGGALKLSLDVPGVKQADIQVTVDGNVLKIQAETKNRRFQQTLTVNTDETDLSQLTAQLSDGVLTLAAPPKAKPEPVQVTITTSNEVDDDTADERSDNDHDKTRMMRRSIEIPGVKPSDVKVTFEGTTLHVSGTRRGKAPVHKSFRIDADEINTSELTANLSHGILTVQAPKLPRPQPQTVAIETATTTADNNSTATTSNDATTSDATVLVSVDMPGVRSQDVTVSTVRVDKRRTALDIRASRNGNNNKKLRISELVMLDHDTYNVDELKAQLLDGVLTITAPKKPDAEPRVVPIVVATNEVPSPKEASADEECKATNCDRQC